MDTSGHGGNDAHGHGHDAHGHDAHGDPAAHAGPAEIPPVPAVRSITPAAADYHLPTPGAGLLWPILWLGVGALLYAVAGRSPHPIESHDAGAEHATSAHGANDAGVPTAGSPARSGSR
jgi:hypothetical protein